MSSTIRPNDITNMSSTGGATPPTLSSTTLPTPPTQLKPDIRKPSSAPRIDLEPLHNTLKSALSDADWALYKSSINAFLLGKLNQAELSQRLDRVLTSPALVHAHNQFILGVYGNVLREEGEAGVVAWADDAVTGTGAGGKGVGKGGSGGVQGEGAEAEKRLKKEVMALSGRERKRLKALRESEYDEWGAEMRGMREAKDVRVPEVVGGAGVGGFQKTNWDLEIRKRYTTPLFTETHEFPDSQTIASRMLPICYESGLPLGHSPEAPTFMNIATETYIKEMLTNLFARVSSNGPSNGPAYVKTARFKKEVEKEERAVERGELGRTAGGLLPVEEAEGRKRGAVNMEDLRLCMVLGDSYLGQNPILRGEIGNARLLDAPGVEELENERWKVDSKSPEGKRNEGRVVGNGAVNGSGRDGEDTVIPNGWHVDLDAPVGKEEEEWQWVGGSVKDVAMLDSVLDSCLAVGT